MSVLQQDVKEFSVEVSPQSLGTQLRAGALEQPHCLLASDVGRKPFAILGFSELTMNDKVHYAVPDLTASHTGKKNKKLLS